MRALVISIALACGCGGERPLHAQPLPPLQRQQQPHSIANAEVQLWPGEAISWSVRWRGLAVGIAELEVTQASQRTRVRSRFRATGFAAQVKAIDKVLVSDLGGSRGPDDIHSALGRVRGWAQVGAPPAQLDVLHDGEQYRVKLTSPLLDSVRGQPAVRVEGEAMSANSRIHITLLFRADPVRVPVQAIIVRDGETIRAELIEYHPRH